MAISPDPLARKRLDSWKEIAVFFARAERTVKRWEAERGLPVHRVPGKSRSAVFAYSDELSDWLKGEGQEAEAYESFRDSPFDELPKSARSNVEPTSWTGKLATATKDLILSQVTAWLLPVALVCKPRSIRRQQSTAL
jgi:hypothetical protein